MSAGDAAGAAGGRRMERGDVWQRLGAPSDQVGSVNDPRTHEDFGVRWNEKWIYRSGDGEVERIVLWLRYDLVGIFRPDPRAEGGAVREEPSGA